MQNMRFTSVFLIALTVLSQSALAADQDLYLLPGDISNFYVSELFDRNVVNSNLKQAPTNAKYSTTNIAARISSVKELNSDLLSSDSRDCSSAKVQQLQDSSQLVQLACKDSLQIYTVQEDFSLKKTGEFNTQDDVNDFLLQSDTTGDTLVLSISQESFPGESTYVVSIELTGQTPAVKRQINQLGFPNPFKDGGALQIWQYTDGATPAVITPFWLAYNQGADLTATTSPNILWAKSDEDISGRLEMSLNGGFLEDITTILDLSFNELNKMIVTYKGAADGLKLAECTLAYDATATPPAVSFDSCSLVASPPSATGGSIIVRQPLSTEAGISYIYNDEARRLSICDYDAGAFSNCFNSKYNVRYGSNLQFYKIRVEASGAYLLFKEKTSNDITSILYNISKNVSGEVEYEQVSERGGVTACAAGTMAFVIKNRAFSTYGQDLNNIYVTLIADEFTAASQEFQVRRSIQTETSTFTFKVDILSDLNQGAAINSILDYQDYNREGRFSHQLQINRRSFQGNNLDFSLSLEGFQVTNANAFSIKSEVATSKYWLFDLSRGITVNDQGVLNGLACFGTVTGGDFDCQVNDSIKFQIPAGAELIYAITHNTAAEQGFILILSKGSDTLVAFVDLFAQEVFSGQLSGVQSAAGKVFSKIIGGQYTFWIVDALGQASINVYSSPTKDFSQIAATPVATIDSTTIAKRAGNFCPTSMVQNARNTDQVDVMSHCPSGESRLWKMNAADVSSISAIGSKLFGNSEAGEGDLSFCSFGEEYIVNNPANGFIFSTDTADDYSLNGLGTSFLGYASVTQLYCPPGSSSGVIAGTDAQGNNWMSAIFGNRLGDARDRYHTSVKIATGTVSWVNPIAGGLLVGVVDGATTSLYSILTEGPSITYDGPALSGAQEVTLNVLQLGQQAASQTFIMNLTDWADNLSVKPNAAANATTEAGSYNLYDIADLQGQVFSVDIEIGEELNKTITIDPQFTKDSEYQPSQTTYPQPSKIFSEGDSSVGFSFGKPLRIYFYKDNEVFDTAYAIDRASSVADASVSNDEFLVSVYAAYENGVYNTRAFTLNLGSGAETFDEVILEGFMATQIYVERINSGKFAAIAVNSYTGQGRAFILVIQEESGTYSVKEVINSSSFTDIAQASLFAADDDIVVLYTSIVDGSLKAVAINSNGEPTALTVPALSQKLAIRDVKCKAFKASPDAPSCIFTHFGNMVSDVVVKFSSGSKAVSFESERQYYLYDVLLPTYVDFNEEFVILKTQYAGVENMLLYNRTAEASNELVWGLTPDQYSNEGSSTTLSIPLVYTSRSGQSLVTNFRFTQRIQSQLKRRLLQTGGDPAFTGFKLQDVKINLSENITASDVGNITFVFNQGKAQTDRVGILDIFERAEPDPAPPAPSPEPVPSNSTTNSSSVTPTPEPPKPDDDDSIPWWVWVIVGMVIFLILVTLLLRYLTKSKDEDEEEDVYYGSEGKAAKQGGDEEE